MLALLSAWVLYPAVLAVVSAGFGFLVDRLAGGGIPRGLLLPVGFAALMVFVRFPVALSATAKLALPAALVVAIAGLVLARGELRRLRPDPWAIAAALGVFLVLGAPTFLSGHPTFAGYTSLPDTSHQLSLAELYSHDGPHWQALAEGSARLSDMVYTQSGYPVGAQVVLGVTAPLGVIDLAWLYQPLLSFLVAMGCLAIRGLLPAELISARLRALIAFVAAQPALVMSFAQQGSIKELAALSMVLTAAALAAAFALRGDRGPRAIVAPAIAAVAAFTALGPAAGSYLAVLAVVVLVLAVRRLRGQGLGALAILGRLAALALFVVVLCIPLFSSIRTIWAVSVSVLGTAGDLGNLAKALNVGQAWGVWLNGDFRYVPGTHTYVNFMLIGVVILASVVGFIWAVRRRVWGVLLLVAMMVPTSLYLLRTGSPYADGKVLAIVSPTLLLLALLAIPATLGAGLRVEAALAAVVLTGGVLVSNALAYHDVSLAPYDRYEELLGLQDRLDAKGPAIFTEYDEFAKYFLRDVPVYSHPEWPQSLRPDVLDNPNRKPSEKAPLEPDDFRSPYVQSVPYMIVRRSPNLSRPPANFRLAWTGRYYELWQRTRSMRVLEHWPLGVSFFEPSQTPKCRDIQTVARRAARAGARLAYVERSKIPTFITANAQHNPYWMAYGGYPGALVPIGAGRAFADITVPQAGRYHVWMEGSFSRRVTVTVDGRPVGSVAGELNNPGAYMPLQTVELRRGRHRIQAEMGGGTLAPGDGGHWASLRNIGPIMLSPAAEEARAVRIVDPSDARSLCGRRMDWVELVR